MADTLDFHYSFRFPDGREKTFSLSLDKDTLLLSTPPAKSPPAWTELDFEKCAACPLSSEKSPRCPVALGLHQLLETFQEESSVCEVQVSVTTRDRTYSKKVALQKGVQSIFGVIMPASGCPTLTFLRPMVQFHLPFSSVEETMVRSTSFYLLSQYFASKKGIAPDWSLAQLAEKYHGVSQVNLGIAKRIHAAMLLKKDSGLGDASPNAINLLETFSEMLKLEIDDQLASLEPLFR